MFRSLPYRIQIPAGLSVAVVVTALLVTTVSARMYVSNARLETLATLDRGVVLLVAQARPLLAADDTWRMFSLLRDTAALIPGASAGKGRLAVLDSEGKVFAASDPVTLGTGQQLIGTKWHGQTLAAPDDSDVTRRLDQPDGAVLLLEPIRSEDGQVLGHVFMEVDASVFTPNWMSLLKTALIGVTLAVAFLVPLGWMVGRQMTRPVARLIKVIERIGHEAPSKLHSSVPETRDPELSRIGNAVVQLLGALEQREKAEARALSSERLAALGRITAAVAHEINNPLMGLLTTTETLRKYGESQEIRERTINLLDRGLKQIRTTLAALLPQARFEDRPLEPGDLNDVVTLVQTTAPALSTHLSARIDIESALRVPSAPVRQVMLNLLINAINAAGAEGRVEAVLQADANRVTFMVTNSGPILTQAKLRAALDAESGSDPRGFGLWVCKELASHYHGGFDVDPHCGTETRLVFWLPNLETNESMA